MAEYKTQLDSALALRLPLSLAPPSALAQLIGRKPLLVAGFGVHLTTLLEPLFALRQVLDPGLAILSSFYGSTHPPPQSLLAEVCDDTLLQCYLSYYPEPSVWIDIVDVERALALSTLRRFMVEDDFLRKADLLLCGGGNAPALCFLLRLVTDQPMLITLQAPLAFRMSTVPAERDALIATFRQLVTPSPGIRSVMSTSLIFLQRQYWVQTRCLVPVVRNHNLYVQAALQKGPGQTPTERHEVLFWQNHVSLTAANALGIWRFLQQAVPANYPFGLVFKNIKSLPGERPGRKLYSLGRDGSPILSYADIHKRFLAAVLFPHDLGMISFDDLYALNVPIFLPAPELVVFIAHAHLKITKNYPWYLVRPEAALSSPESSAPLPFEPGWGGRDAVANATSSSAYHGRYFESDASLLFQAASVSNFVLLPHVHRFQSLVSLLQALESLGAPGLQQISRDMQRSNAEAWEVTAEFYRRAAAFLLADAEVSSVGSEAADRRRFQGDEAAAASTPAAPTPDADIPPILTSDLPFHGTGPHTVLGAMRSSDVSHRAAASLVLAARQPHSACVKAWNSQAGDSKMPFLWYPNPSASKYTMGCVKNGGNPFFLYSTGNTTIYFPDDFAMCLPRDCSASFLRESLVTQVVFLHLMAREARGGQKVSPEFFRQALGQVRVKVEPIVTLPADGFIGIDFVIGGFPLSATTSLARELARHPQVVMPHGAASEEGENYEDDFFWKYVHTRKFLRDWMRPLKAEVQQKAKATPLGPVIVGLKEPMMIFHQTPIRIAAMDPKTKLILMLREPLELLSSFTNHACDWFNHYGEQLSFWMASQHRLLTTIVDPFFEKERVLLVPTAGLRLDPVYTYGRITDFLGIRRLEAGELKLDWVQRANAQDTSFSFLKKRRFDFCEGQVGVVDFQFLARSFVRTDIQELEKLLEAQKWPRELWNLRAPSCPRGTTVSHWMGDIAMRPSVCHVNLNEDLCFHGDFYACERCCEELLDGCDAYGPKHRRCCDVRRSMLLSALVLQARRQLCNSSQPCEVGRGTTRWWTSP